MSLQIMISRQSNGIFLHLICIILCCYDRFNIWANGLSVSTHEENFIADLIIQQILAQFSFFFFSCEFGKLKDDILEEDKRYFKQMFLMLHESESKTRLQ